MTTDLYNIAAEQAGSSGQVFYKFISANDLGLTGGHQSGYYVSREAAKLLFDCDCVKGSNETVGIRISWADGSVTDSNFKYYGCGSRNESRITTFGRGFEFMRPEYLGALLIICRRSRNEFCASVLSADEDIEQFAAQFGIHASENCGMVRKENEPADYRLVNFFRDVLSRYPRFPDTYLMSAHAREGYNQTYGVADANICNSPDEMLLKWIDSEYQLFQMFEEKIYQPVYSTPFQHCQELIDVSNEILNRRKSRAGKSLEHHLSSIFTTSGLDFEEQAVTEDNKKPDFLFPGSEAYHSIIFPDEDLTFLGAKTTCKDRWRQVLNEADRIKTKYLFTLQQGVSSNQMREMRHENLLLVVPKTNISCFAMEDRPHLLCLKDFIGIVRRKQDRHARSVLF